MRTIFYFFCFLVIPFTADSAITNKLVGEYINLSNPDEDKCEVWDDEFRVKLDDEHLVLIGIDNGNEQIRATFKSKVFNETFDCSPGSSWFPVTCNSFQTKSSIVQRHRMCAAPLICDGWTVDESLTLKKNGHVVYKSNFKGKCILKRVR